MILASDDGIVLVEARRGVNERFNGRSYLAGPAEFRRKELVWGVVREPPAPWCDHQAIVSRALVLITTQVSARSLGRLFVSPVDVVLDDEQAWGATDLVVEVLSAGTRQRDLTDTPSDVLAGFNRPGREFFADLV